MFFHKFGDTYVRSRRVCANAASQDEPGFGDDPLSSLRSPEECLSGSFGRQVAFRAGGSMASDKLATSIPVEVDPVQRNRLWIALEEYLGQLHLEVAAFQRYRRGWLAVIADLTNLHPERAFRVEL